MPNYFYFDQTNQKHGPIDDQQLRELAVAGIIKPNTPLETVEGHKGIAKQIPGLSFTASTNSGSAVPEWYAKVAMICGIVCVILAVMSPMSLMSLHPFAFRSNMLRDIIFVVGMFFGCRGMSLNKTLIAKIGLILCIIAFVFPRMHWIFSV